MSMHASVLPRGPFVAAALSIAATPSWAAQFGQQNEHRVDANAVWGLNVTRGVRTASQKATGFLSIDTREAHLNKTVTPRISNIQSNRELLRSMPTCFDPDDPARIPWYGNVEENYTGGGGGGTVDKSAWWKFTLSIKPAPNVTEFPRSASVKAYFPTPAATISMGSWTLYPEGDPAANACDDYNPCFVYSYSFDSSDPSLPIMSACNIPGVTFSRQSSLLPQADFDHRPKCANNMYLKVFLHQVWACFFDIEGSDPYCTSELGGTYTIHANWSESTSGPPPSVDTVTHTPVTYDYDPRTCSPVP
ncbi:hypothetical protein [Thiolapillus sp.]|uniref:hypothetical protein n=2 Tax=Thiolapillus sp. TaxID=2017437 RepID=UPI0025D3FD19|nr:hypothetical protein [Thiolapillus sp.]